MLDREHFVRIAANGFGDPHNSYAWSMAWFKGKLYVGTIRDTICLQRRVGRQAMMAPERVPCPEMILDLDLRPQIWRYTPETRAWEKVYTSPIRVIPWLDGQMREVPRDLGYRTMVAYTDRHGVEALYVATLGLRGLLLRTVDGTNFEVVSQPGLGRPDVQGFRAMTVFDGRLYISPAGTFQNPDTSSNPAIYTSDSPGAGAHDPSVWWQASEPGFGDAANEVVFEMASFNGWLYASTGNPGQGYQLWKTRASGTPPYSWLRVIAGGAYRGAPNRGAPSLAAFGGALYVGSGTQPSVSDPSGIYAPWSAELVRVFPDDTWELVVGDARETPEGTLKPVSDLPSGFGNPFAAYAWRMADHNGCLYLGTLDVTTNLPYLPEKSWSDRTRQLVAEYGVEGVFQREGGFDLWRSQDGVSWSAVTRDGFGNPYNFGVRSLVSTPIGLAVGTANPFTVAADPETSEPLGGLEVWLGAC